MGVTLGIMLAILGVGLLVGTRYGRARWLLWLAIPLAFITFGTVTAQQLRPVQPELGPLDRDRGRQRAASGAG